MDNAFAIPTITKGITVSIKSAAKTSLDLLTRPLGIEIKRRAHDWDDTSQFIPLQQTLSAAKAAGMSVGDYIDTVMNNIPGATQWTIDEMAKLGVFEDCLGSVVEIGPGSGRYLEKTLKRCKPARYEIYETAQAWAAYLVREYGVIAQPTDGKSLKSTATNSVDLVHAHKVFNSIDFLPTAHYWNEMVRIVKRGGFAVFDIIDESCLAPADIITWTNSGLGTGAYPAVIPDQVVFQFFQSNGFNLVGSFFVPLAHGRTKTLVFKRF